jgi:hypothetical protein
MEGVGSDERRRRKTYQDRQLVNLGYNWDVGRLDSSCLDQMMGLCDLLFQ